ncbi:MAG: hypothetical protein WD045_04200 [Pirellulaceae bacterium]
MNKKQRYILMVAGRKQQIGVMAGCAALLWMGVVLAQEEITPIGTGEKPTRYVPQIHVSPPPETMAKPSAEELKEIEWIKSQLGSSHSIAARLERLTVAENTPGGPDLPKIVGPDQEVFETRPSANAAPGETLMLRSMARQLEESAADLELRGDYQLADEMRALALSHWRLARVAGSGQSGNSREPALR